MSHETVRNPAKELRTLHSIDFFIFIFEPSELDVADFVEKLAFVATLFVQAKIPFMIKSSDELNAVFQNKEDLILALD